MINKPEVEFFLESGIKENRPFLEKTFNQNFDTQQKTLPLLIGGLEHSIYNDFKTAKVVWNLAGFVNLVSYDLKIIVRDLTFAPTDWQKKLYARQAYLLIYESMNDILSLLGKNLRDAISHFSDAAEQKQQIQLISSKLNKFKSEHEITIKTVRHTAIAHREKDILIQLKSITSVSWYDSFQIATGFDSILNELGSVCQQLINRCNDELSQNEKPR